MLVLFYDVKDISVGALNKMGVHGDDLGGVPIPEPIQERLEDFGCQSRLAAIVNRRSVPSQGSSRPLQGKRIGGTFHDGRVYGREGSAIEALQQPPSNVRSSRPLKEKSMQDDIRARLPQDAEKILRPSEPFRAGECDICEDCGSPAALVIQGETDSFGWEPLGLCQACYEKGKAEQSRYDDALDIEDKEPPEGKLFKVDAITNIDSHHEWNATFRSLRKATAYLRRAEKVAAAYAGLYPRENDKVLVVDDPAYRSPTCLRHHS